MKKKLEFLKKNADLIKEHINLTSNSERYSLILKNGYYSLNDPDNGVNISELGDLTNLSSLKKIRSRMMETSEGEQILTEMPRVNEETIDFKNLKDYNKKSMGFAYYQYMAKNNFTPNDRPITKFIPDIELSYICQRYKETHDFYHILLNLESSLINEVALKWFEAEHLKLGSSSLGGLFGIYTLNPMQISELYVKLLPGIILNARNSKFLLGIYYEKRLQQDLDELRKELGINIDLIHNKKFLLF